MSNTPRPYAYIDKVSELTWGELGTYKLRPLAVSFKAWSSYTIVLNTFAFA